jgi:hypothetical protein
MYRTSHPVQGGFSTGPLCTCGGEEISVSGDSALDDIT